MNSKAPPPGDAAVGSGVFAPALEDGVDMNKREYI